MIDPKLLGDIAKDHQKNLMTRDEAKAFLKDQRTVFRGVMDRAGRCSTAQIDIK